jgi:acyl-CoA thioester hydrolase
MITSITSIRVRYAETDQMRSAYYGRYFEYFEQARSDMLRNIGLPYPNIEEMGLLLPVIEAHAEYRRPARYDEEIHIHATLKEKPVARVRVDYEVLRDGDKEPIAAGYTIHSFVNAETGKPTRAPGQFLEAIERAMAKR